MLNTGRPPAYEFRTVELPQSSADHRVRRAVESSRSRAGDPEELGFDQPTRVVLLLFLRDPDRWWTAGAMTRFVDRGRDTIRAIHRRLVEMHWATQVLDDRPARMVRYLVRLTPLGIERARYVLRDDLTPANLTIAANDGDQT
jgi:hypothetical protein